MKVQLATRNSQRIVKGRVKVLWFVVVPILKGSGILSLSHSVPILGFYLYPSLLSVWVGFGPQIPVGGATRSYPLAGRSPAWGGSLHVVAT